MQACLSYVLTSPLSAVRLTEGPVADVGSISGGFCVLPAGETIAVKGESSITGLIDIECEGAKYAIFRVDLEDRAEVASEAY